MRLLSVFRLMLALVALGAALTGPAAATRAMAAPAMGSSGMPCHEAALSEVPPTLHLMMAAQPAVAESATSPAAPHLCCVLSPLVVTLQVAPALVLPEAERTALALPEGRPLAGLTLATPVPPPRLV